MDASDRLLAFVEASMKFGNLVDPRSNEWTHSFIRTPLQKGVVTCGPEKYDLPVLDTSDDQNPSCARKVGS